MTYLTPAMSTALGATPIRPAERIAFDPGPLAALFAQQGEQTGHDAMLRMLDEIESRLRRVSSPAALEAADLADEAATLAAMAARLGLSSLQAAASGVADTARHCDAAAQGATLARLRRIGDRSLSEFWGARIG